VDGNDGTQRPGFTVSASSSGIVRLRWRRGRKISGSDAAEAMAAVDTLNDGQVRPLLVDMAGLGAPTRDARQQFGRLCTASRIALVGRSVVDRVGASFVPVPGLRGFPVPTRFFTSEVKAVAWLLSDESESQP
jgi:hypothetical protein